ncbi:MAG: hypothetical protein AAF226_17830, partial [Verrucomicrobiota bacterium]
MATVSGWEIVWSLPIGKALSSYDIVTYGIFVENRGTDEAYDLKLNDALFVGGPAGSGSVAFNTSGANWIGGTVYNVTSTLSSMNFQAMRGDGQTFTAGTDFFATYNTSTGDIEITFNDLDTNNDGTEDQGILQGGRDTVGGPWTNTLGTNVLMLTYDVTIGTGTAGLTANEGAIYNFVSIDEYSATEGGDDVSGDDPTKSDNKDAAEVEFTIGRSPDIFIRKNDGVQVREIGESYDYTLTFGNQTVHDDGVTPTGEAQNVIITDILPPELEFNSLTVTIEGNPFAVTPTVTALPDGSTQIVIDLSDYDGDGDTV